MGQGEVVGLLGPNGAGKTTTFYMIVGLTRPDSGSVMLGGHDITDLPMYLRAKNGISYLPQEASVFRKLTVEANIMAILETFLFRARSGATGWKVCWRNSALRMSGKAWRTRFPEAKGVEWR